MIFAVIAIAIMWKVNTKAGQPGWAAIIPIYNLIVMLRLASKPWWWIFLLLIPLVNIIEFTNVLSTVATAAVMIGFD